MHFVELNQPMKIQLVVSSVTTNAEQNIMKRITTCTHVPVTDPTRYLSKNPSYFKTVIHTQNYTPQNSHTIPL